MNMLKVLSQLSPEEIELVLQTHWCWGDKSDRTVPLHASEVTFHRLAFTSTKTIIKSFNTALDLGNKDKREARLQILKKIGRII